MSMGTKGIELAFNITRDITVAALNENPNISFIRDSDTVAEFFATIYRKVDELVNEKTIT